MRKMICDVCGLEIKEGEITMRTYTTTVKTKIVHITISTTPDVGRDICGSCATLAINQVTGLK